MRDAENEVTCPDCGATHHDYPRRTCRACLVEAERTRADLRRSWRAGQ